MSTALPGAAGALFTHPVCQRLAHVFGSEGHELYLVGGSVRDAVRGERNFSDLDFTTDARPEHIRGLVAPLGPLWTAGERFGTVGVQVHGQKVEVTTFRTEHYIETSRKPQVSFGDTVEEDLVRRDFTVNALALCLVNSNRFFAGELVDLFEGVRDLAEGRLRTPRDPYATISEDPLRSLRALRFAYCKGPMMHLDPELEQATAALADRLSVVSVERRTEELRKMAKAGGSGIARAFDAARRLGIARALLDELAVDEDLLDGLPSDLILAALAVATGASAGRSMRAMRLSLDEIKFATQVADSVQLLLALGEDHMVELRRFVRNASTACLDAATELAARKGVRPIVLAELVATREDRAAVRAPLPVNGDDLVAAGLSGPPVGKALRRVTEAFLADPGLSKAQALEIALENTLVEN